MEFCHSYLFVTFVVMTVDQIVERNDVDERKSFFLYFKVSATLPQRLQIK